MTQHQAMKAAPSRKTDSRQRPRLPVAPTPAPDRWMELQRGIGNQAVGRLLRGQIGPRRVLQRKCACGGESSGPSGECEECRAKKPALQAKLQIGASHDVYEQEADRVAQQVTQATAPADIAAAPLRIQRLPEQGASDTDTPASVDHALAQPGEPLNLSLRRDMEQRFGHDFSHVRMHYDAQAMRSASDVNARAYTVGHDIVFGAGQFAPATGQGRRLLAHELTHVAQQSAAPAITRHGTHADASPRIAARAPLPLLQRQPLADAAACEFTSERDMSPGQWLGCMRAGHLKSAGYPLRFTATGVIATSPEVLRWAIREQFNDQTAIDRVNSHEFSGNQQARAEAQANLKWALADQPLDARRAAHSEELERQRLGRQAEQQEVENAKRRAAIEWAVKEYYEHGTRLKPRGAELLTIEQAADAEREGLGSKPHKDELTGVSYRYGQTVNRATFVVARSFELGDQVQ